NITLHFAQCDGRLGKRAVAMEDGIMGIFPTLMNETVFRPATVLDETVTVCVAIAVDPLKRALDVRPNRLHKSAVTRALVICACQHHKKRRCIDAPVVAPEWHLTQDRHFVIAELMQDFAGLRILLGLLSVGLIGGEIRQNASRDRWIEPHTLQRCDDSIAPEHGAEPGNTSVRI